MGNDVTKKLIYNLLINFYIIPVGGEECLKAYENQIPDFENAIVIACAEKDQSDYIVTNDNEFLKTEFSEVSIISLNDFIKIIK